MYEALREMVVANPEGGYVRLNPGEVVPGFETWPVANQMAAINTSRVRERPDGAPPASLSHWPTPAQRKASLRAISQPWLSAPSPAGSPGLQPEEMEQGPVWVNGNATAPVRVAGERAPDPIEPVPAQPQVVEVQAEPATPTIELLSERVETPEDPEPESHICGECDFKAATAQGLRLHFTKKHRV